MIESHALSKSASISWFGVVFVSRVNPNRLLKGGAGSTRVDSMIGGSSPSESTSIQLTSGTNLGTPLFCAGPVAIVLEANEVAVVTTEASRNLVMGRSIALDCWLLDDKESQSDSTW